MLKEMEDAMEEFRSAKKDIEEKKKAAKEKIKNLNNEFTNKILLEDLLDNGKKVVAIYGGGFKPPTKGHFAVVEKAAEQDPEIDDIIIYVGGGERDGITQGESIQIWELYKKYLPLKTRIEPSKAPVGDVLRYAKEHPEEEVLWIIGARENNPEDFTDIASRTRTIDKYPNLQLRIIQTTGGVSGTAARKAVKDNNKEQFFHLIPDIEEKEQVWDIVSSVVKETLNEYNNTGPSTPKVYIVKADGTYKEVPIGILSKIPNLTYDMGGGETNYYLEKNIVIVDNIPVEQFAKEPGEIKDEKIYVEYNLNQPFSFPKANKIFAAQVVYHLGDIKSFAKTVNDSLKNGGTFQFFSDLMNKQDKEFLNYLSSEYGFGLPKNLNPYKGGNLLLKKGEYTEPVISYIYSVTDAEGNTAKISVTKEGRWWEYAKIEGDIDFKPIKWSVEPEYKYNNITPSKEDVLYSFSKALETDIVDFKKLNETLDEGSCGYDTDVATGKKLNTPGGLEEGRPKKKDPKKGTGKKPEGSGRRLYTDEDPKDTVRIKFKTKEDIVDTLNKTSFKTKSHARQSQVINLIHQRVRAAYGKAKDPEVKSRLKRALDYIEKRKEASKKKTERLRKMKEASDPQAGTALPYGSGFAPLKEGWNLQDAFVSLSKFMIDNGMNIKPLPKIKVIKDDKENASDLLGKTAYYDPNNKSITLFTMDRHPKDILRSFSHEMVHHEQNLNGKLNNINTTNTNEDGDLPEIEREAYEKGNIMLRNWEDTIKNV
jgi:hypothetical protein